ncbi:predicted protein [Naegleria gruberi]|nr:uncharacterized protein NAEGRDRAFT_74891 [Naegleria gruberi]EFC37304.1 predicted protein [Naegleria gruberi]|eukprot:XP_002670048.1 predicted protein [Naegleria gruberi strain NEG-M]
MISKSKFEKIKELTQLDPYDLFLHKALILSLDMVSYFDSERYKGENHYYYSTLERCCLISEGLFTDNFTDTNSLGLLIDLEIGYSAEDLTVFEEIHPCFVAISINFNSNYLHLTVPKHAQYLCFSFADPYDNTEEYESFLEGQDEFPNVRDLTIKFPNTQNNKYLGIDTADVENNILSAITRKRFPKLLRLSIQGSVSMENLDNYGIFSELLYVEIINNRRRADDYVIVKYWTERTVHSFIKQQFIEKDSLIHQLVLYANICRNYPDADYNSIKEYYDMSKEKFVPCIAHSSVNEYYDRCYE